MHRRDSVYYADHSSIDQYVLAGILPAFSEVAPAAQDEVKTTSFFTPREMEIFELVAVGYTAKQIARILNMSPRTVETHLENARSKMGARNSTHMVKLAAELGIETAGMSTGVVAKR